jgi:predicted PurR-regulated permease PerM
MRRHFRWDRKYLYWGITAFCVIAAAILFYMALRFLPDLRKALGKLLKVLSPFIWGFVITYLIAPLMRLLERSAFGPLCRKLFAKNKKNDGRKLARALSILVSELAMLAVLTALVYLILPQLYSSIETIVKNGPDYLRDLSAWATGLLDNHPEITKYVGDAINTLNTDIMSWVSTKLLPGVGNFVTTLIEGGYVVVMGIYNLLIGIIVSIYLLSDLEHFTAALRKLNYSWFSLETAEKVREAVEFTDRTFMGFISGKLLDSAIIGLICYIVCAILNMPYALLVSVIVGVTNIIPFFGPLIGAVPSALIILMVDPLKCLIFIVFVIILQQIDGNFIGPKILGNSIGITSFWVLFAIVVGAGLFGFGGMILGVPVFVVIYTFLTKRVEARLKKSDLPWETAQYEHLDHIDPVTRQPVKKPGPVESEKGEESE